MLVTMLDGTTCTDVGTDAEVEQNEADGVPMYEYDIFTSELTPIFDGSKWLADKPNIGPFESGRTVDDGEHPAGD